MPEVFKSAVAVIKYQQKWLLGLAVTEDDRNNKWTFPAGHIEPGETAFQAAEREAFEEAGVKCRAIGKILTITGKNKTAFIPCNIIITPVLAPNHEFATLGLFSLSQLRSLKLYDDTRLIIEKARKI
jgi:8-oxo-dGTP pyrophosphatase MutT (NUDIX family)